MERDQNTTAPRAALALLVGALILGIAEGAGVLWTSAPSFDGLGERARFLALEVALAAPLGAIAGLAVSAFLRATRQLAAAAQARLCALLAAPVCGYVGWAAFRGAGAQRIPGHQLLSLLVAVAGIAAVLVCARLLERTLPWLERHSWVALFFVGAALYLLSLDARMFTRLYAFFHRGLEAGALALLALAVFLVARRAPRASLAVVCVLGAAGAITAGVILRRAHAVSTILAERSPLGGVLQRAYPRRARPAAAGDADPLDRAEALPPGLRIGPSDIVLITIDAMRADRLIPRVMPYTSQLAERGVRFTDAYTQVPHTSFSLATLLTGKYVYSLSTLGLDAASHETLAEVLRRERYKTAAFFPPAVFFIDHDRLRALEKSAYGFEYVKYEYLDADKRTDQVIDFFEHEHPARAFVWVHYLEPHEPYDEHKGYTAGTLGAPPADPEVSPALNRYEGELRYVDHELERLVEYLRRARPDALIVLAADHGEEFGEHGGRYHGTTLFDEQVRVPLVFAAADPASSPLPARRVSGPVGLVDVAPTVLSLLGVPASAKMRGRDLSPWMGPTPPPASLLGPVFAEIDRKKMVVDGTAKLACDLETGACALYDHAIDPAERRDLTDREPEVAARLHRVLDRFLAEESRYERKIAAPPGMERVFERARQGDAQVVPVLAAALAGMPAEPRTEALRLLVALPADPSTRPQLAALSVEGDEPRTLLDVARARVGDEDARARVRKALAGSVGAALGPELYARAALVVGDVDPLAKAIERIDDRDLRVALAHALARTHDPRALDPLVIALAPVRSRVGVVRALGELGDPRALPTLERWLAADPYVTVRVAIVRVLGKLGQVASRPAMAAQLAVEREAPVLAALADALPPGRYGAAELRVLHDGDALSVPKGEQAIVLAPGGTVRVAGAHPAQASIVDGAATFSSAEGRVALAGPARLVLRPIPREP